MATGALDPNGIWQYGEDDSEPTFSGLLNKLGGSVSARVGAAGQIIQTVYGTTVTAASSSTTTYADTGLTATITPKYATSKILVFVDQNGIFKSNGSTLNAANIKVFRGTTEVAYLGAVGLNYTASNQTGMSVSGMVLDSPATTAAVTYKTQFANGVAAAAVEVQANSARSSIVLMEVKQ